MGVPSPFLVFLLPQSAALEHAKQAGALLEQSLERELAPLVSLASAIQVTPYWPTVNSTFLPWMNILRAMVSITQASVGCQVPLFGRQWSLQLDVALLRLVALLA